MDDKVPDFCTFVPLWAHSEIWALSVLLAKRIRSRLSQGVYLRTGSVHIFRSPYKFHCLNAFNY